MSYINFYDILVLKKSNVAKLYVNVNCIADGESFD